MTQFSSGLGPIVQVTDHVVRDGHETVVCISNTKLTLRHPNGTIERRDRFESVVTEDGFSWHAGLLAANPPVYVGVCRLCRHPPYTFPWRARPRMGLVLMEAAEQCTCGALVCGKHRRLCRDGQYRCLPHAWRWRLRDFLLSLLCSRG